MWFGLDWVGLGCDRVAIAGKYWLWMRFWGFGDLTGSLVRE